MATTTTTTTTPAATEQELKRLLEKAKRESKDLNVVVTMRGKRDSRPNRPNGNPQQPRQPSAEPGAEGAGSGNQLPPENAGQPSEQQPEQNTPEKNQVAGSQEERERQQGRQLNQLQNRDRAGDQSASNAQGSESDANETAQQGNRFQRTRQSISQAFQGLRPSEARKQIALAQEAEASAQLEVKNAAANKAWTTLWQRAHVLVETFVEDLKILSAPAALTLFGVRLLGQFISPTITRNGIGVRLIPKLGMKELIVRIVANAFNALIVFLELVIFLAILYFLSIIGGESGGASGAS